MSVPPGDLVEALRRFKQTSQQDPTPAAAVAKNADIELCFDGGGTPIAIGAHCYAIINSPMRISGWFAVGDPAGSIGWDLNIGTFADFPTLNPMTGVGATAPSIGGGQSGSGEAAALDNWTLDIPKGSVIHAVCSSNDVVTVATLNLRAKRLDID